MSQCKKKGKKELSTGAIAPFQHRLFAGGPLKRPKKIPGKGKNPISAPEWCDCSDEGCICKKGKCTCEAKKLPDFPTKLDREDARIGGSWTWKDPTPRCLAGETWDSAEQKCVRTEEATVVAAFATTDGRFGGAGFEANYFEKPTHHTKDVINSPASALPYIDLDTHHGPLGYVGNEKNELINSQVKSLTKSELKHLEKGVIDFPEKDMKTKNYKKLLQKLKKSHNL